MESKTLIGNNMKERESILWIRSERSMFKTLGAEPSVTRTTMANVLVHFVLFTPLSLYTVVCVLRRSTDAERSHALPSSQKLEFISETGIQIRTGMTSDS